MREPCGRAETEHPEVSTSLTRHFLCRFARLANASTLLAWTEIFHQFWGLSSVGSALLCGCVVGVPLNGCHAGHEYQMCRISLCPLTTALLFFAVARDHKRRLGRKHKGRTKKQSSKKRVKGKARRETRTKTQAKDNETLHVRTRETGGGAERVGFTPTRVCPHGPSVNLRRTLERTLGPETAAWLHPTSGMEFTHSEHTGPVHGEGRTRGRKGHVHRQPTRTSSSWLGLARPWRPSWHTRRP